MFILMDLGQVGRFSDGEVLAHSAFGRALENGSLHFPVPKSLSGSSSPHLPFVIVGDEAFPLRLYMLRPYPGRNLSGMIRFTYFLGHDLCNFSCTSKI